jgi:hypothetical protein
MVLGKLENKNVYWEIRCNKPGSTAVIGNGNGKWNGKMPACAALLLRMEMQAYKLLIQHNFITVGISLMCL